MRRQAAVEREKSAAASDRGDSITVQYSTVLYCTAPDRADSITITTWAGAGAGLHQLGGSNNSSALHKIKTRFSLFCFNRKAVHDTILVRVVL